MSSYGQIGVTKGSRDNGEGGGCHQAGTGSEDNKHTGKAEHDGGPPPPADVLTEERYGKCSYHQRCGKSQGQRIDERHPRQAKKETEHCTRGEQRAQEVPSPYFRSEVFDATVAAHQHNEYQQAEDAT